MYNYDSNSYNELISNLNKTTETTGLFATGIWAFIWSILWFVIIFGILFLAWKIVYRWFLFKKAGKNGWEAIIPFYSSWTLYEISGFPGWFCFLGLASFIPFVKYVVPFASIAVGDPIYTGSLGIIPSMSICKKFNKTGAFWVLVWLLPYVGLPILAFGKDKYDSTKGEQKNIQPIK